MDWPTPWYILISAFILDLILGDPHTFPHPVRWMGKTIALLEKAFRSIPARLVTSGALFSILLIAISWGATALILRFSRDIHPFFGTALEIVLIYYSISARSLEKAAQEVLDALQEGSLEKARIKVSRIVGRDVNQLDPEGVARAAVESVAENLVDGVVSPLFYAAIGGAPLAMAYKMVNTLDSMIGHKNEAYIHFGKAAARIDDGANYIPARLSVPLISLCAHLLAGKGKVSLLTAIREGRSHFSPNSGFSEAAFAGALVVRLGGPNRYAGKMMTKPFIGKRFGLVKDGHIRKACDLMLLSSMIWVMMLMAFSKIISEILL
ncbi:MAG: cobalamin biosynthesis protein CobD [Deltaproteobacteria bacterium RBG_13_49_15]|nr:MAG: cobalamin biosynthesis protein CobD [Deltaproteobacteria bacterium RBG_13_49_15]